jgi:hypothetical protein
MTMKLMTKEIRNRIPTIGAQEKVSDPIVHVKYFEPCGSWTWYITEASIIDSDGAEHPMTADVVAKDVRMFGWVRGFEDELGYVSLNELSSVRNRMGLGIERDLSFRPTPLSKIKSGEVR